MPSLSTSPSVLIAGRPSLCKTYQKAVEQAGYRCLFPSYPNFQARGFDLLLLPGGGDISPALHGYPASFPSAAAYITPPDLYLDLLQLRLLHLAFNDRKPVLGICKGMQMINLFFGGTLHPHLSTADKHKWTGSDQTHPLYFVCDFSQSSPVPALSPHRFEQFYDLFASCPVVNSAHHQGVQKLGNNLITLQCTGDGLPETIIHKQLPILGLQWHPERLPGFCQESFGKLLNLLLHSY